MERDEIIEERISMEIIVDTYGSDECAMGWYCYLEDKLDFPFPAQIIDKKRPSPFAIGTSVYVIGMSNPENCLGGMWVVVDTATKKYDVPLEQIYPFKPAGIDKITIQAIEDWRYWVGMGYLF